MGWTEPPHVCMGEDGGPVSMGEDVGHASVRLNGTQGGAGGYTFPWKPTAIAAEGVKVLPAKVRL